MSLKQRIFKNGAASLFQKLIKVAEQLLLIPFFIKFWGAEYYGEWLTLTIFPSFLALSDFGFGTATANTFLLQFASGKKKMAADTVKTGLIVLTFVIAIMLLFSFGVLFVLNKYGVLSHSLIPSAEAFYAIYILIVARILSFYQGIFEAYYRAARKAHISISFQSIISLISIIVGLVVLFSHGKALSYALTSLFISLFINPLYIIGAIKILKFKEFKNAEYIPSQAKILFSKGLGYFLSPVWQAVYFQGTTFVIRIVLGATAVTIFNTMRTLIRSSSQAFGMVVTSLYPEFQYEVGIGNREKMKKIFIAMFILNMTTAILFVIGLLTFGPTFYRYWTHNQINISYIVWCVFICSILFYAFWYSFSFIFEAFNKPYQLTVSGLIASLFSVMICWYLSIKIGILGGAIGMLSFDIVMALILYGISSRVLRITTADLTKFLRSHLSITSIR